MSIIAIDGRPFVITIDVDGARESVDEGPAGATVAHVLDGLPNLVGALGSDAILSVRLVLERPERLVVEDAHILPVLG
jgi:hypothetical protein